MWSTLRPVCERVKMLCHLNPNTLPIADIWLVYFLVMGWFNLYSSHDQLHFLTYDSHMQEQRAKIGVNISYTSLFNVIYDKLCIVTKKGQPLICATLYQSKSEVLNLTKLTFPPVFLSRFPLLHKRRITPWGAECLWFTFLHEVSVPFSGCSFMCNIRLEIIFIAKRLCLMVKGTKTETFF